MPLIFEKNDWAISKTTVSTLSGYCLRHLGCRTKDGPIDGVCGCNGWCDGCKVVAPDEIIGFFRLVKWKK